MAQDLGDNSYLSHESQEIDDAIDAVAALTEQIATKQDILTFDSIPTDGSTNPVTSGGVFQFLFDQVFGAGGSALDGVVSDIDTLTQPGTYRVTSASAASGIANMPIAQAGKLLVIVTSFAGRYAQVYIPVSVSYGIFVRNYIASGWQPWYAFTGTAAVSAQSELAQIMSTNEGDGNLSMSATEQEETR